MTPGGIPGLPPVGKAFGGPIVGPGSGTSDSVLIAASNGEHMWTANEVAAAGGHAGVEALRKAVLAGGFGLAAGGAVPTSMTYPVDFSAASKTLMTNAYLQGLGAPANVSGNAAIVQRIAGQHGWGSGAEWNALYNVVMRESGFRNTAQNPTSSAYGMFQFLDSTWAGYGVSKTSDPVWQAIAGMSYIAQRYGDPLGAYRHEQSMGWYKDGTNFVPNDGPAYLHRGEAVVPASKNQGAPYQSRGPLVGEVHVHNQVDLDLLLQQAEFRQRAGSFT